MWDVQWDLRVLLDRWLPGHDVDVYRVVHVVYYRRLL